MTNDEAAIAVIDWAYVHSWCERHGTRAALDDVRRSIAPI